MGMAKQEDPCLKDTAFEFHPAGLQGGEKSTTTTLPFQSAFIPHTGVQTCGLKHGSSLSGDLGHRMWMLTVGPPEGAPEQ